MLIILYMFELYWLYSTFSHFTEIKKKSQIFSFQILILSCLQEWECQWTHPEVNENLGHGDARYPIRWWLCECGQGKWKLVQLTIRITPESDIKANVCLSVWKSSGELARDKVGSLCSHLFACCGNSSPPSLLCVCSSCTTVVCARLCPSASFTLCWLSNLLLRPMWETILMLFCRTAHSRSLVHTQTCAWHGGSVCRLSSVILHNPLLLATLCPQIPAIRAGNQHGNLGWEWVCLSPLWRNWKPSVNYLPSQKHQH